MRRSLIALMLCSVTCLAHAQNRPTGPRWLGVNAVPDKVFLETVVNDNTLWFVERLGDDFIRLRLWSSGAQQSGNERWLDGASEGQRVQLVSQTTHGTIWKLERLEQGMVRLRSWNETFRDARNARWLDGASDGTTVKLVNGTTHGTRWKLEDVGDAVRLRSCNNTYPH